MSFLELAGSRYTTKKYDANGRVSDDKIEALQSIIRMSPSSINSQPWKFTFVSDTAVKQKLAAVSYFNEQKINDASHLVVFSAIDDISLFEEQIKDNLPQGSVDYYHKFIKPKADFEIKSWLQHQVYLSLGFFLAACASLEIDSTPMEGIENDQYRAMLGLTKYQPLFAVALGFRNPEDANQPVLKPKFRLPLEKVVDSI